MVRKRLPKRTVPRNKLSFEESSDLTSHYIAENKAQKGFGHRNNPKSYDDSYTTNGYRKYFEKYGKDQRDNDLHMYNDYTTSSMYYDEQRRRLKYLNSPQSRTDETYDRRSPTRQRKNSPQRDVDKESFQRETMNKKKYLQRKLYYSFDDEGDVKYNHQEQSPYKRRDYRDLIHEEPEKENDFKQYFEKTSPRESYTPTYTKTDRKKAKLTAHPHKLEEYEVYAYQEPPPTEGAFRNKRTTTIRPTKDSSITSEIQSHEYPVLAFTDQQFGKNGSGKVYLPVVVLSNKSKKSKPEETIKEGTFSPNTRNFQILAANLKDQSNMFQNLGEERFKIKSEESTKTDNKFAISSGLKYAGSVVESLIDEATVNTQNIEISNRENRQPQRVPFTLNTTPFTYQVDVDILANDKKEESINSRRKTDTKVTDKTHQEKAADSLQGKFPVSKDYIKVNYPEKNRKHSLSAQKTVEDSKRGTVVKQFSTTSKVLNDIKTSPGEVENNDGVPKYSLTKYLTQDPLNTETEKNPLKKHLSIGCKQGSAEMPNPIITTDGNNVKLTPAAIKLSAVKEENFEDNAKRFIKISQHGPSFDKRRLHSFGNTVPVTGTMDSATRVVGNLSKSGLYREPSGDRKSRVVGGSMVAPLPETYLGMNMGTNKKGKISVADKGALGTKLSSYALTNTITRQAAEKQISVDRNRLLDYSLVGASSPEENLPPQENLRMSVKPETFKPEEPNRDKGSGQKCSLVHENIKKQLSEVVVNKESDLKSKMQSCNQQNKQTTMQRNRAQDSDVPKKSLISNSNALKPASSWHGSKEDLKEFTKHVFQVDIEKVQSPDAIFEQRTDPSVGSKTQPLGNLLEGSKSSIVSNVINLDKAKDESQASPKEFSKQKALESKDSQTNQVNVIKKQRSLKRITRSLSHLGRIKAKSRDQSSLAEVHNNSSLVQSYEPSVAQNEKTQDKEMTRQSDTKVNKRRTLSRLFSRSKSRDKSPGSEEKQKKNKIKPKKSRSFLSGILRKSKSGDNVLDSSENLQTHKEQNSQYHDDFQIQQPCQQLHVTTYIISARTCARFFLGNTLHEQIMDILKMFY